MLAHPFVDNLTHIAAALVVAALRQAQNLSEVPANKFFAEPHRLLPNLLFAKYEGETRVAGKAFFPLLAAYP